MQAPRAAPARPTRYIDLGEALLHTLQRLGGEAPVDTVLAEIWRRYVEPGNGERVSMRLYVHPSGRLWSPEAEAAIRSLEALGLLERRGGRLRLRN